MRQPPRSAGARCCARLPRDSPPSACDPQEVPDVVITHMHYDHAGNVPLFPQARFHVQDAEMAYCTGRAMTHAHLSAPFDAENVVDMVRRTFDGRVVFHAGDAELYPGVTLHHLPGHTLGLQAVRVQTERGPGGAGLGCDPLLGQSAARRHPTPIVADVVAYLEALRAAAQPGSLARSHHSRA